jgi:hypothetical protein
VLPLENQILGGLVVPTPDHSSLELQMTLYIFLIACCSAASTGIIFKPGTWYASSKTKIHANELGIPACMDDDLPADRGCVFSKAYRKRYTAIY